MPDSAPPARYDLPWKAAVTHAFHPFMDFCFPDFSATSTGGNGGASAIKNCLALASRRTSWWLIWWLKSGHEPDKRYTAQPHLTRVLLQHQAKALNHIIRRDQLDDDFA